METGYTFLTGRLRFAVIVTSLVLIAELVGGFLANSLALLSDAGHVFTDVLALGLSWFGVQQAERPASHRMTFGYHRIGILIAIVNATALLAISLGIFYEAYRRLQHPEPVSSSLMLGVAALGFVANLIVVMRLEAAQRQNLNVRSAFLHALGDALSSVGVVIGGGVILATGWFWIDPTISVVIGAIIMVGAWRVIKEGVNIFLETSPRHIDMREVVQAVTGVPGVRGIHDLHVWSITPQIHAFSCHVLIDDLPLSEGGGIMEKVREVLNRRFGIGHCTIQLETAPGGGYSLYCNLASQGSSAPRQTNPPQQGGDS